MDLQLSDKLNNKKCEKYRYLVSLINQDGTCDGDISYRFLGRSSIRMNVLLWSTKIELRTKLKHVQRHRSDNYNIWIRKLND